MAKNNHCRFCITFQKSKLKVSCRIVGLWKAIIKKNYFQEKTKYNENYNIKNLNYENKCLKILEMDLNRF